jgi:hypothetical protein
VLQPLAAPARANNPISEFFSAISDGRSAGRIEAAQFGIRQTFLAKKISQQYFDAADQVSQRLVDELAAQHPDSKTFAWVASHQKELILSDPPNHAADLQIAATMIYQEGLREEANASNPNSKPATRTPGAARREESTPAATKATAPFEPASLPSQPKKKLPPAQAITILLVFIGGIAGLVRLMRRRRKPVNVAYVHVKSPVEPADASQSQPLPAADRGTDGR